jgi:hypothetical protein
MLKRPILSGKSKSDSGYIMMEVLGAIIIASLAGGYYLSNNLLRQRDNTRVQIASTQMKTVSKAAAQYAQANASGILGSLRPGSATGLAVPLSVLESSGALPTGFNAVNPWGQTINVMYFEPVTGTIAPVVYTTGGNAMESRNMVLAAKIQGAQGGYVPDATLQSTYAGQGICSGSCVQGAGNSWQFPMSVMSVPTTAGHLVSYSSFNKASLVQNTLYRYPVPGNSNASTMGTNINMNGFTISNLPTVSSGGTCTNPNGIAVNTQGYVVTCVSGTWQNSPTSQWGSISNPTSAKPQYGNGSLTLNGSLNTSGQPITNYSQGIPGLVQTYCSGWVPLDSLVYFVYSPGFGCSPFNYVLVIGPGLGTYTAGGYGTSRTAFAQI